MVILVPTFHVQYMSLYTIYSVAVGLVGREGVVNLFAVTFCIWLLGEGTAVEPQYVHVHVMVHSAQAASSLLHPLISIPTSLVHRPSSSPR